MVATFDWQEANERNLHASQRAQCVPSGVADIETRAVASHADQHEDVQWQQVGDEHVSTPGADHVAIEERAKSAPHDASELHSLDPEVECKDQQEDCNGLVIV